MRNLITDHLDIWTAAHKTRSTAGRGSNNKLELVGIKKLRELILELAVRGKLVPQDPSDEPASELLKNIAAEKAKLIKEKAIKKTKTIETMQDDDSQFDVPSNWSWVYLNDLGDWGAGATPSRANSAYYGGNIPWFKSGELNDEFISQAEETVTELALKECSLRENKIGDVLIAMYGATIGKSSILSIPATTNQAVCACTPFGGVYNRFLLLLLRAFKSRFIGMGAGGAQPNISREKIIAKLVPLPPLTEQHRIVAKVDELMAFCDQLEQTQSDNIAAHAQLVEALLATLTNSSDHFELQNNWQRIAAYIDTLFTTEHSIDQLKQTILQLAVMGKLVPQNRSDEPASELLKKIAAEKAQLIKEGKIKKEKPLPEIADEEKPFGLPSGWEFVRLQSFATVLAGNAFKSEDFSSEAGAKVIKITNAGVGEFVETPDYLPSDFINTASQYLVFEGDFILALTRPYIADGLKISKCPASYNKSLLNQRVAAIRINQILEPEYFYQYFRSHFVLGVYLNRFGGSGLQPNLKMSDVTELVFAIPPIEEQHRIVTKVDELMTLCDTLKTNLQNAQTTQLALADALVERAVC